jgi:hypothetical protein
MAGPSSAHDEFRSHRARQIQASVRAAVECPLCTQVTPERGIEIIATTATTDLSRTYKLTNVTKERAGALLKDKAWRTAALSWISAFWAEHGHGPTWSGFLHADQVWPHDSSQYLRRVVMAKLYQRGHLDGTKTPFGLKACDKPVSRIPGQRRSGPMPAKMPARARTMTDITDSCAAPEHAALAAGYAALNEELGEELQLQFTAESHAAMLRVLQQEARTGQPPL